MDNKLRFISNTRKDIGRTIYKYKLINDGDRIIVGLSGGKDSLILLEALADRKAYIPFKFELIAVHVQVDNIPYKINIDYLKSFCNELNVPFYLKNITVDIEKDKKKAPCFVCSWYRRKTIFSLSQELHCNKIALGHHMDDAVETLLMNLVYHGSFSSLPQKLTMFDGRMELIRPLLLQTNDQLSKYAIYRQFPEEISLCPFSQN